MERALSVFEKINQYSDAIVVILILIILGSLVLPVPPFLLDILLTFSITFSMLILMAAVYVESPLKFSSFPSILLIATLFRLSLNVASTRRILLHGHEGPDAAGHVIQAFGQFVVGGNYVVGIIVFLVLVIINFIVITKGTERISEVAARFTLDAMPGKQMSIDADLNSGLIDEKEAQRRRQEVQREADFYGAMDGATKFIRGDAVAGIIIVFINIIGGIIIGMVQKGMDFQTALQNFTILTIGDGLVSQIPALITSTAAGLMVTRAASEMNLGREIFTQLTSYPKALFMAAGAIFVMGIIPGMPTLPFLILASIVGISGYMMSLILKEKEAKEKEEKAKEMVKSLEEEKPEDYVQPPEPLTLEIGYGLIYLVDENQGGELLKRIKNLRKQLTKELGLLIPLVHIKDNLELKPNEYRLLIKGVEVAKYEVYPGKYLAIDTGMIREKVEGVPTKDPAFGLNALWIDENLKDKARISGYTVVDVNTVIITHLSETIKKYSYEILTRQQVKELLDIVSKNYPMVKDIVPDQVPLNVLHKVLQNLLKEGIPIKDIPTIVEALSDNINKTADPDILTEYVRMALKRVITSMYQKNGEIIALVLGNRTENYINKLLNENKNGNLPVSPVFVQKLITTISQHLDKFILNSSQHILITSPIVRRHIKQMLENYLPNLVVLSYGEIENSVKLNIIGMVDVDEN
ncbi:flagellar biosynthesis protein FlhA [Sulfurihydrogenibium azorense Az-Fu1]|uniref:Flagellar biosynthesis protein FlhA n=1 Tax=Sulfurihydrogenibium azorense (strain DSM 15241 / OCM 825 / Az-Fu1) TaxID=204536 RepID=C1DW17_SULAA|nr:flagellar biosynthesis protein FlhA [Sulfurihydrogenibium azorense]ACN98388.1 flagellar biosynthesis protein FlhA [Sulfurihydrogenibium azorense Az-Fu1]